MFKREIRAILIAFPAGRVLFTAFILALLAGISTLALTGANAGATLQTEGRFIEGIVVDGKPPDIKAAATSSPEPNPAAGINIISNVPAFDWSYGCSATSAAMLFGYYDRIGYSNMYTGPTNGGICPLDNTLWPVYYVGSSPYHECPLSATHQGIDGRTTKGHVDDYWIALNNTDPDPWITNGWTEHTWGDCTGDYMGTSQSSFDNPDGATLFYYWSDGSALYDFSVLEPEKKDGCHGMREFAESRGYSIIANFSQRIKGQGDNPDLGFTFSDFRAEIDAGRPVLIQVTGHTMLGYGYDTAGETIYIRNTWNNSYDTMTWGGTYSGMQHFAVTVIRLTALSADSTNPSVTINDIAEYVNSIDSISGTASDTTNGISFVEVLFYNATKDKYFNGISWTDSETWIGANGTTSWNCNASLITFFDGDEYLVKARATDDSGNVTAPEAQPSASCIYDTTNPSVSLEDIDDYINTLASISGTASDTTPGIIQKVQVSIINTTDSTYWNDSTWVTGTEIWLDASGTSNWSFTMPSLTSGKAYQVKAKSLDMANNESSETSDSFIYDTISPSITITGIDDYVNTLTSISGTASDTAPGKLDKVQVVIKDVTGNTYWNGSGWIGSETWVNASGTSSWSYNMPSLTDGKTYQVKAKSIDKAGNESLEVSDTFSFDTSGPSVTVSGLDGFIKTLTSITGSASDTGSGTALTQLYIYNSTDNTYWDGDSWETAQAWLDATGTTSWSYSTSSITFDSGRQYTIKARATDTIGNVTASDDQPSESFIYDNVNPTVTITDINDYLNTLSSISGTASDTSPGELDKVQVVIKDVTGNTYWNESGWIGSETWVDASGTSSWIYTMPSLTDAKVYLVKAKSIDKAGNESSEASDSFIYDTTNPSTVLSGIPDFVKALDSISGTASETLSGEVDKVQITIYNATGGKYWDGDSWETVVTWLDASGTASWSYDSTTVTFSDGNYYMVQAKSSDKAGNEAILVSDSFSYDFTSPLVTLDDIPDFVNTLEYISGSASDTSSGELYTVKVMINNTSNGTYWDGSGWMNGEKWVDASGTTSWSYSMPGLTEGETYQVKAKSLDKAGNESIQASGSFTYDTAGPSAAIDNIQGSVKSLSAISGTASDIPPGEIEKVQVAISNTSDGTFWNGVVWLHTITWLDASGTTTWSYDIPSLTEGKDYDIKVKSIDKAGNESLIAKEEFSFGENIWTRYQVYIVIIGAGIIVCGLTLALRLRKRSG